MTPHTKHDRGSRGVDELLRDKGPKEERSRVNDGVGVGVGREGNEECI